MGKRSRALPEASKARPATYTLDAEPGRFDLTGGELDVPGHWLARVLNLTTATSASPHDVTELRNRVLTGLGALRGGGTIGPEIRTAAEDAIVAALALGFYHLGGPVAAGMIEKAASDQGKRWTAPARANWKPATVQRQTEGERASKTVAQSCHELWRREPEVLKQRAWIKATIKKIHSEVMTAMLPHIAKGSLWVQDAEGLDDRMANHVRTAGKTFSVASKQIP